MNRRGFLGTLLSIPALARASVSPGAAVAQDLGRLGASTACLAGFPLLDAIRRLRELGFGTLEVIAYTGARHSVGEIPGFSFAGTSPQERERVFEATREFRHITAHLPFQDISLFSSDRRTRETGLERIKAAIDGLAFLEGELGVIHIGWPEKGKTYRDIWTAMTETLRMLGDYAAERNIRIGIETMQPNSVQQYVDLVNAPNHAHVGATVDTGHIRGAADIELTAERRFTEEGRARFNDVLITLVSALGDKLLHFHLSDVRPSDWADHRTIGSGVVDFPRLFRTVRAIGYQRLFVFELEEPNQVDALERSQAHVRRHIDAMPA